ncbi:Uncharacterized conserved protein, contains BTB/POZ domain [Plasmopara halstedii]|uniref:Uncharacterized conserved protein, contains BTB/POZ domain n=1 Tax=Plasmopara halstedii TaxID=4781 RepID=A0A0N7L780_PLAHL|nr:Uncharacterized conserved protein, contains BTB/POZ domain [Plasmopara halstedii]CEG46331.1 Uncharacterized conserved protein, contains BTB/POZ domain [Plasmopara halstedii]|eukprot:XP_024582700.1 Uncharacterized conserved protein, contains BTB/POZ domain [Plasmopara halstedii]
MSSQKPRYDSVWASDSSETLFGDSFTDDDSLARRKQALKTQEEDQTLLHRTVVASKRQNLEVQFERVAKQRAFIRREKRRLLLMHALLSSERERFEAFRSSDWFCLASFPAPNDRRVTIDIGGQLFELSAAVALKDSASLLAAFVQDDSPLCADESGCFRVDRDWRLFRHILRFLRDGILPSDPKLLRDLYVESEFWRFESLLKAIEIKNLELWQLKQSRDLKAAAGESVEKDSSAWWMDPPAWWGKASRGTQVMNENQTKVKKKKTELVDKSKTDKISKDDYNKSEAWWNDCTYKGIHYADNLDKAKNGSDEKTSHRHPLVSNDTWPAQ